MPARFFPHHRRTYGCLLGLIALAGAGVMTPAVAQDSAVPKAADSDTGRAVPATPPADRQEMDSDAKLKALQRQHKALESDKRTKAPFTSDRTLRHDLRRNERQQGWEKSEQRRLEYEDLKRQRGR